MLETEEWVVRMSPAALEAALKLEHECEQRGLNSYDEAQDLLAAAQTAEELELRLEVWGIRPGEALCRVE
jgi:hypothetical protein